MAHVGLFWSRIKKEFKKSDQQPPIAPIESAMSAGTGFLMPRTWLIHNDENYLIQIQQNLFYLNWRRIEESNIYPHYDTIKPQFEKRLKQFYTFLDGEELQRPLLNAYELTYINLLPIDQGWERLDQISDILPDLCWRQDASRFLPSPKSLGWQAVFGLPENRGDLYVQLQTAISQVTERPVLRLELSARYAVGSEPSISPSEWFDVAHEWIVQGFADLTSREIQLEHWKRVDDTR